MARKIEEVYIDEERWNPVCQATIPAAWVAVVDGYPVAFANPWDYPTLEAAKAAAVEFFV